jgi:hypothetical protein
MQSVENNDLFTTISGSLVLPNALASTTMDIGNMTLAVDVCG